MILANVALAADPVAQRSLASSALVVGLETSSVNIAFERCSFGALARTDGGAAGLVVGTRRAWVHESPFRNFDARDGAEFLLVGASASVLALPVARGAGLGFAPWTAVGIRGNRGGLSVSLATPVALGWAGALELRVPATLGVEAVVHVDDSWGVGAVATAGGVWVPGLDTSLVGDVGLSIVREWGPFRTAEERDPPRGNRDPLPPGR